MKFGNAKSLLEALSGRWVHPSQRELRLRRYQEIPLELRALAEQHQATSALRFGQEPQKASCIGDAVSVII